MDLLINAVNSHLWAVWALAALIFGAMEIFLPFFGFLFAAVAALASALVSFWWGGVGQCITFSVVLLLSLGLIRPRLLARLYSSQRILSRTQALVGKQGLVTEEITPIGTGRVQVEGQDWAAQSFQNLKTIAVGKSVTVEGSDGIILVVREI